MQRKPKPCKGTGIAKGYGCETEYANRVYGLCPKCLREWAIEDEEGKKWLAKQTAYRMRKNEKEKKKEENRKQREARALTKDWSKELQVEINKIVRYIDNGLPCLARNQRGQMHAGHVYARGGNQTIKYNLHNIHRQCAQSNHHQNDDGKLREGVVNEYGQRYMDFISELRQTPTMGYNNVEYRELTDKARAIYNELSKKERIFSKSERIEMRNRINLELGIYDRIYCEFHQ